MSMTSPAWTDVSGTACPHRKQMAVELGVTTDVHCPLDLGFEVGKLDVKRGIRKLDFGLIRQGMELITKGYSACPGCPRKT